MLPALCALALCVFAQITFATHVETITTYTTTTICPLTETFVTRGQTSTQTRTTTSTVTMEVVRTVLVTAPPLTVTREVNVNVTESSTSYFSITVTPPAVTFVNSSTATITRGTGITVTLTGSVSTPSTPLSTILTNPPAVQLSTETLYIAQDISSPVAETKTEIESNTRPEPKTEPKTGTEAKINAATTVKPFPQVVQSPSPETAQKIDIVGTIENESSDTASLLPSTSTSAVHVGPVHSVVVPTTTAIQVGAARTWKVSWAVAWATALFFACSLG